MFCFLGICYGRKDLKKSKIGFRPNNRGIFKKIGVGSNYILMIESGIRSVSLQQEKIIDRIVEAERNDELCFVELKISTDIKPNFK